MALDPNIGRIKFLRSKTAGRKPTTADLDEGELAINLADRTLYTSTGTAIVDLGFAKGGEVNGDITQTGNITTSGTIKATKLEGPLTGNADSATKLQNTRTLSWTGDATGSLSFNGSANVSAALALANSGVAAGTYKSVTVDAKGRVTAGSDVITGLVTSTAASGTTNAATSNTNTYLNIVETIGSAATTVGTSTQVTGAGTVTVTSDTAGKLTITGSQNITGSATSITVQGNTTALEGTQLPPDGFRVVRVYNNGYPAPYGNVLQVGGTGQNEVLLGWPGADGVANTFIRNKRDTASAPWSNWRKVVFEDALNSLTVDKANSLVTARTINGVAFNGTANITLPVFEKTSSLNASYDLNNRNLSGVHTEYTWKNAPGGVDIGGVLAINYSNDWQSQLFFNMNTGNPQIYARNFTAGTTWGSWKQLAFTDGNISGNAASATKLQTSRTIGISGSSGASGSVSFDGTGNALIPLSVITQPTATNNLTIATTAFVQAVNSADTGSAATALALKTARTINGVAFNGTANITIADNTKLPLTGGTITGSLNVSDTITITNVGDQAGAFKKLIQADTTTDGGYLAVGNNATDKGYVEIGTIDDADTEIYASQRTSANAVTRRAKLLDGSGNTSFPGTVTAPTFSGALSGNATTASSLATARTINGVAFNGTTDIQIDAIRVGTITWHLGERSSIFAGDLSLDGQILNRADYPELWSMVNAGRFASVTDAVWLSDVSKRGSYSTGNGSTTFRLPDLNGGQAGSIQSLFLRGSSTTPVGTVLSDAIRNITGSVDAIRMGIGWTPKSTGALKGTPSTNSGDANNGSSTTMVLDIDASRVVPTADENRPKSVFGIWVVSARGSNVVVPGGSTAATLTGGNTFQGSQTINGDLIVNQNETVKGNLTVEGLTADRFGLHDKMHWVGASVKPYGTSVLNASVTTNTFQVIIRGESGAKYWTKGRTKLHFIINHGNPQNARFVTATVTDWSTTDSNKQTITATLSLVNHAMPLNTVFHWVGSTYESFGCDWAGWMNTVGDSRLVMRLKPTTPLKSLTPIITSSCSSDSYWNASQLSQPGVEPQQHSEMGSIVINSVHEGDVVFSIGDNNNDRSVSNEYVSISVKDFV